MQLLAFEVSGSESVLSVNGRIEGVGDNFNVWLLIISDFTTYADTVDMCWVCVG